jgi:GNAT superfamily N-acetyltransferase
METIERFIPGEEGSISGLIRAVYDIYIAPENEPRGNEQFIDFITPANILARVQDHTDAVTTCKIDGVIAGVLSVRDGNHISLLFVDEQHHGKGIARRMILDFIARNKPLGIHELTVNASPFSVGIYERLGFARESALLELHGIRFVRMRKVI